MHLLVYVDGIVLIDKDNYLEWSRNIKHTLIFNDICNEIYERHIVDEVYGATLTTCKQPTTKKNISILKRRNNNAIWKNINKKVYVLINTTISEEVS